MVWFIVFGTKRIQTEPPRINAAYAFCVKGRPERIYWAIGSQNDPAAVVREAANRIFDAVESLESPIGIGIVTSVYSLKDQVDYAHRREDRRKKRNAVLTDRNEEEWLKFATQYRLLGVNTADPTDQPDEHVFRMVKKQANLILRQSGPPELADPEFTQRDDFDLASDLRELLLSNGAAASVG